MARLKISLPDKFVFSTEIPIRIGDINRVGHLGHESFLVIAEEARERLYKSINYSNNVTGGIGFIIVDLSIIYLGQGRYGQTLRVDMAITDITARGFNIIYRIVNAQTGVEIARARTGHLVYDYDTQKTVPVPPDFTDRFRG